MALQPNPTFVEYLTGAALESTEHHANLGTELVKASPPAITAAMTFFGHPVAEWVSLLMAIYAFGLCVQTVARFGRWIEARTKRSRWFKR
jgi:hypothetical protein